MKVDRRLLLAGLAVAATIFTAASTSSASAEVWKHRGVTVTKFIQIGLSGSEVFQTSFGNGMVCDINATLTTEGGSTGKITKFETPKCTGFGGFAKCSLATAEPIGLPWTVDVNATDLTITGWSTRRTFKAGCGTSEIEKLIPSVTATLDTPAAISEMEFSGAIMGYEIYGSLTVNGANKGTYGIG